MSKAYHVDLQTQVDEIKKMIEYNIKKQAEYTQASELERPMSEEQYMKLIARTALMQKCIADIERLDKQ